VAVVLANTGPVAANITATWEQVGLGLGAVMMVRDTWAHEDRGATSHAVTASVESHDTAALLLTPWPPSE
jgi:hypothetical protein